MTKGLFALLLAGSLMVPLITPALGGESTVGLGGALAGDVQVIAGKPRRRAHPGMACRCRRCRISTRCNG